MSFLRLKANEFWKLEDFIVLCVWKTEIPLTAYNGRLIFLVSLNKQEVEKPIQILFIPEMKPDATFNPSQGILTISLWGLRGIRA